MMATVEWSLLFWARIVTVNPEYTIFFRVSVSYVIGDMYYMNMNRPKVLNNNVLYRVSCVLYS